MEINMKEYTRVRKSKCFACGYSVTFRETKKENMYFPKYEYIEGDVQFLVSSIQEGGSGGTSKYCSCPKCGTMKHIDFLYE